MKLRYADTDTDTLQAWLVVVAIAILAYLASGCGQYTDTTGPSTIVADIAVSVAPSVTGKTAGAVSPSPTGTLPPEAPPVIGPSPTPTEEPTATPDPCPVDITQSTWVGPMVTLTGVRAYIRCEAPADLPAECNAGMAYFWSHVPNDGYYSFQTGRLLPDGGFEVDSTVFPNGPITLYCSPMAYTGLWYPNPAEAVVEVVN